MRAFTAHFDQVTAAGGQIWSMGHGSGDAATAEEVPDDAVTVTELAVAVQRVPWKLRADLLSPPGDGAQPDVLVVDGTTSWAWSGPDTTTNGGNPRTVHGGGDITHLLSPGAVPQLFDLTVTGDTRVAGRPCTAVTATRRPAPDGGWAMWPEPPFAMITGGTRFRLDVDLELGILPRVVKVVDDLDAEITEFTDITIDEPLLEELFAPLPHARVRS